jgi:hypothetical protein
MKKIILVSFLFLSMASFGQKKDRVKGSKTVKLEQKQIDSFESLEVEDNLEVFLVKGKECALEIEADDNLIEFIEYKLAGSNLRISTSKDLASFKKLSVRVTYTDSFKMVIAKDETNVTALSDVTLNDITFKSYDFAKLFLNATTKSFTLMANDKLKIELNVKSDKTAIDISKSAYVKALIATTDMKFDMYQKSSADIEGEVAELKLRLDNNTDFNGKKLVAKNATIETTGYAKSSIAITNIVSLDASGDSETEIYGQPIKYDLKRFADTAELYKKTIK